MASSKNNENQLLSLFQEGSLGNKKKGRPIRLMAPTVPLMKQRGFQPMQQHAFSYR